MPSPRGAELERTAVTAMLWGGDGQLDACRDQLHPDLFVDPWCRDVVGLLHRGHPRTGLADTLARMGWVGPCAPDPHRLPCANGYVYALPFLLGRIAEEAHRRQVLGRLVALAYELDQPGGPERVEALLSRRDTPRDARRDRRLVAVA